MRVLFLLSCAGLLTTSLLLTGCGKPPDVSIGDQLINEVQYAKEYKSLPLTVAAAKAANWTVSDNCVAGRGRLATITDMKNKAGGWNWHGRDGGLHLWYDKHGDVMGMRNNAKGGVKGEWNKDSNGTGFHLDFLFRDPESACGNGPRAVENSVGDRLTMVGKNGNLIEIPLTLEKAQAANYNDGGPCFPKMGWHMMYDRYDVSSPTPVYEGPGMGGKLFAMNLNAYTEQQLGSWEHPAPKEGNAVYGWHVYFDTPGGTEGGGKDVCANGPTAFAAPFINTSEDSVRGFECTPYFGNMWVMAPMSVVDLKASGVTNCGSATGTCTVVNYLGPTAADGYGTPCRKPSPTTGCHCYHQVTYNENCLGHINSIGKPNDAVFNSNGVLSACANFTNSHTIVGWKPNPKNASMPLSCECNSTWLV